MPQHLARAPPEFVRALISAALKALCACVLLAKWFSACCMARLPRAQSRARRGMRTSHASLVLLYTNCVGTAFLAASTAQELKNEAEEANQEQPEPRPWARASSAEAAAEAALRGGGASTGTETAPADYAQQCQRRILDYLCRCTRWSDEDAQILSCSLYMLGDVVYAVGSIFYFPKIAVSTKKHLIVKHTPALCARSIPFISRLPYTPVQSPMARTHTHTCTHLLTFITHATVGV